MTWSDADRRGLVSESVVEVVPLGGLGEFGMNMMAFGCGETLIVVDAGVMFPEAELLGVDLITPDFAYLQQHQSRFKALVLTHGHEDHIGAVPYLMARFEGPVYGTPLTLAFLEHRLSEHGIDPAGRLRPTGAGQTVSVGPFQIEFIRVTHSMPDCVALAIHTPIGVFVHTGDFKVDQTPLDGHQFDFHRLAQLGSQGVHALFGDSTNSDRRGFTGSELAVVDAFEEVFTSATGKIVVTAFTSSIYRLQILVNLAVRFGRRVIFVGRSMIRSAEIAQQLGYLQIPVGVQVRDGDVKSMPARDVLCIAAGSQGEPMSALARIAVDEHRQVKIEPSDTVVFSARAIPGNEKAIGRVINHVARRGAEVIDETIKHVHVSGHGSEEELKLMLSLVRPRYFVPIHGEHRQLARHARFSRGVTTPAPEVLAAENGDRIVFTAQSGKLDGKVQAGRMLIDGTGGGEIADEVLRDRRHLAEDGLVLPVVAISRDAGRIETTPEMITRGFVVDQHTDTLMRDARATLVQIIEAATPEERADPGIMRETIRNELRRFFRKRTGQRPFILPVLLEI